MELNVVAKIRILPEGADIDLEKVKADILPLVEEIGKVHSTEIKPIAFGLRYIELTALMNDSKGGIDDLEQKIKEISGVGEVDVTDINRL